VRASVCGPAYSEADKAALPDHTLIAVSCASQTEAHFVCALLNSSPAQVAIKGYIVLHPSPHILEHIAIPRYDPRDKRHNALAELSEACHGVELVGNVNKLRALEAKIDRFASELWKITTTELAAIRDALNE
jgi:hypothetical protein